MRRYLQGTLDYACGIYAVINALSLIHAISLDHSRFIFQETLGALARHPAAWQAFLTNSTDQYWLIRYLLERWCSGGRFACRITQPFGESLLPRLEHYGDREIESEPFFYLQSGDDFERYGRQSFLQSQAEAVWGILGEWFQRKKKKQAALVRFHRFFPGHSLPLISHWTTARDLLNGTLYLHDASAEFNSLHAIQLTELTTCFTREPAIVLVPASLLFLERA